MIYPPKRISSSTGLGVGTEKTLAFVSDTIAIGTEIWGKMERPWAEGKVVIARPGYVWRTKWETGKPYIITKFFDDAQQLVGIYCDICRPVERDDNGFVFDDLYLDVWQVPGATPTILDQDELAAAHVAGYIHTDEVRKATSTAQLVAQRVANEPEFIDF